MKVHFTYSHFFVAALLPGCFFIASCTNPDKEIQAMNSKQIGVEEAKDVAIDYSISGKTKAKLTAPYMLRHEESVPFIEFTKTVHTNFFDDTLGVESWLDARYARYMETESKIFLKDSVRLINRNGDTLYSDELYWDRSRTGHEFYTDKPVRIRTRTEILNGVGFESNMDFKNWSMKNLVNSEVRIPSTQFPQ